MGRPGIAAVWRRRRRVHGGGDCRWAPTGNAVSTAGAKGDVGHLRFPMSPLDTPLTFRWPLSEAFAAKRGLRGLGSVRRFAYGTLSGPEVSLRDLPRITVRGQTVQGGSVPLRKAPLPSSVDPWSTRRLCGSLAFRRATEGSRVLRKVWGVKRGKKTLVVFPLLPPPPGGGIPSGRGDTASLASSDGAAVLAKPFTLC